MNSSRCSVQINETETEYLLSIHASQKERAKRISGYRWDTERRCWVYPKTARIHDALIEEFGDDLIDTPEIIRPDKSKHTRTEYLQTENQDLKEEIAKIHKTLELISGAASDGKDSEVDALRRALAARESELTEVRHYFQEVSIRLEEENSKNREIADVIKRLQDANKMLQSQLEEQSNQESAKGFKYRIRNIAKDAANHHPKFCSFIDQIRFDKSFPSELEKRLNHELRRALNCDDRKANLRDLITQARDAELLTDQGIDLAHIIRKQRNFVVHEVLDETTLAARVLFCLFAASLLWSEFSE